jgi:hypothetical protein
VAPYSDGSIAVAGPKEGVEVNKRGVAILILFFGLAFFLPIEASGDSD